MEVLELFVQKDLKYESQPALLVATYLFYYIILFHHILTGVIDFDRCR